jgi:tRNA1(Val) A37 N6-methylase TrmN6
MKRFETPADVAEVLARHAPRHLSTLLDPSVGTGSLVLPLLRRLVKAKRNRLVVVDIDNTAIRATKSTLTKVAPIPMECFCADFLKWSKRQVPAEFDCVVMNPPFNARTDHWVTAPAVISHLKQVVPVEIAFLFESINQLRPGGRLLAVVPATIVSGENTNWVRRVLFEMGSVLFVRELPRSTFAGVESRFYLLIFEKEGKQGKLTLCNHDISGRERIVVPWSKASLEMRLDFAFFESRRCLDNLRKQQLGEWTSICDLAAVIRGKVESPEGALRAIHTTDYSRGFWHVSRKHRVKHDDQLDSRIIPGDILVKRVGRQSLTTFGQPIEADGLPFSDCVLCIRPQIPSSSARLLFTLRCLFTGSSTWGVLERGSGASFLTKGAIERLEIPADLSIAFSEEFSDFRRALVSMDFGRMLAIERRVQVKLGLRPSLNHA